MRIRSQGIVQSFKPIRVDIELHSADEMDTMRNILQKAMKNGLLTAEEQALVQQLLPHFARL